MGKCQIIIVNSEQSGWLINYEAWYLKIKRQIRWLSQLWFTQFVSVVALTHVQFPTVILVTLFMSFAVDNCVLFGLCSFFVKEILNESIAIAISTRVEYLSENSWKQMELYYFKMVCQQMVLLAKLNLWNM